MRKLWIEKTNWEKHRSIHLETVEISREVCCFEWEGEQAFRVGDELNFRFDLREHFLNKRAAIVTVDKSKLLDEGYEHQTWHSYCARFDDELDDEVFKEMVGSRRQCKSRF